LGDETSLSSAIRTIPRFPKVSAISPLISRSTSVEIREGQNNESLTEKKFRK
jgi:hypothetical protein